MNEITLIIRELAARGVSQKDMSKESGLSQGRISQISTDGGTCAYEAGQKLAALLKRTRGIKTVLATAAPAAQPAATA